MKTLTDILIHAASRTPERRLVFARRAGLQAGEIEHSLSYAQLYEAARRSLAWLQAQGARPGQRLVVQCQSAERQIVLFWACQLGGLVPVLLPRVASWRRDSAGARKLAGVLRLLQATGETLLVIDADQAADYRDAQSLAYQAAQGCRWLVDAPQAGEAAQAQLHPARAADLAYLQFSSGTTGQPKGVQLTHANLVCNIKEISDTVKAETEESTLSWMPYYHDMGLISFHLVPLYRGMGQVKLEAADFIAEPLFWLRQIARHRAAVISSPNFGLQHVLDRVSPEMIATLAGQIGQAGLDLSCVRLLCNGAEPISAQVMRRFCDLLAPVGFRRNAMFPVYGLAEACVAVTFSPIESEPVVHRLDRAALHVDGRALEMAAENDAQAIEYVDVGYPLPAVRLRIANAQDEPLAERRLGEVQIRGANVTAGYLGGGAENMNADLFTADGWLKTGDLGFLLEGRLTIAGRLKDVIFLNGRNLMAADVERWLMERCAGGVGGVDLGLKEGSVAVCAATSPETGREQVALFLARSRHRVTQEALQAWAEEVRQAAEEYLAHPLAAVLVLPRLPRTSSGKLQRRQLAQDWLAGRFDEQILLPTSAAAQSRSARPAPEVTEGTELAEQIRQIWAEVLACAPADIALNASFTRLGGGSVQAVDMLARLEELLGRELGFALLIECRTIADILAYLQAGAKTGAVPETAAPATVAGTEKIAIIGLAGRFPGGETLAAFWESLRAGRCLVDAVPAGRWFSAAAESASAPDRRMAALPEIDAFAAEFFGITTDEACIMDPQQRLMLELAYAALEDAGHAGQRLSAQRAVGVYLGASSNTYLEEIQLRRAAGDASTALQHPQLLPANLLNLLAARIAHVLNLKGPALTIDTACSSSLVAVQQACNDLLLGHCELALAGGVNLLTTGSAHDLLAQAGALSAAGLCRTFDARADGMVPGEGGGLVVLKPLARALADGDRIEAVIDAVAVNNDGRSIGIMAPTPEGQEAVLRLAYQRAGVRPQQISYVEAHGTGTPIGDPIEIRALSRVFAEAGQGEQAEPREQDCPIGSVKTNIGHLLAAAGIAGLIKVLLALRHEWLPPGLHLQQPHPRIRFERTPFRPLTEGRAWPRDGAAQQPRHAAVSSFGFGGTNAHLVLHEGPLPENENPGAAAGPWLLPLAARTADELARMRRELAEHLRCHPELRLRDVCYSRAVGRENNRADFRQRVCYRVGSLAEAIEKLAQADGDQPAALGAGALDALDAIGQRWLAGENVDWLALFQKQTARMVALPTYPWTRGRYWLPPRAASLRPPPQLVEVTEAEVQAQQRPAGWPSAASTAQQVEDVLRSSGIAFTDRQQSFASLGVDSLLALKVSNLLQERLGLALSAALLFEQDSPARLAAFLQAELARHPAGAASPAAAAAGWPPVDSAAEAGAALSPAQQRLWFLEQLQREQAATDAAEGLYNIASAVRLRGPLQPARLAQALDAVMQRHEMLRTRFVAVAGEPRQFVVAACRLSLPLHDLSALAAGQREQEVQRRARAAARQAFVLEQAPLWRAELLRLAADEHVLLLTLHHLIADGWSLRVLMQEVAALYAGLGFSAGQAEAVLPALPVQYKDYWQQQSSLDRQDQLEQLDYWVTQLRDAPALLNLATDHPRPARQTHRGARHAFVIDAELSRALQTLARGQGATLYMVLLAALQWLLARYSGQQDICVGTPVANRPRRDCETLIGLFVNTLVMRSQLSPEQSFVELLAQLRQTVLAGFARQTLPFEQLVDALQPTRSLQHTPLFQVLFVLQNLPAQALLAEGLHYELVEIDPGLAQFDLILSVQQSAEAEPAAALSAFFEYNADLFEPATIARLAAQFTQLLSQIVRRPQARLADHAALTAAERQLLARWNATRQPEETPAFPQRFAAWAAHQPQALALSFENQQLTYGELDARSNQLAHHLRQLAPGLGPDSIVALCLERSPELVIALLAVLKTGAAYLPLEPEQPAARIAWILADAQPALLISQSALLEKLPGEQPAVLNIDQEAAAIGAQPTSPMQPVELSPKHLAYVIYTSGSTGQPKGVLLTHRGLSNLAHWQGGYFSPGLDSRSRVLQFASCAFDAFTWELVMALAHGASLHLAPRAQLLPGQPLADFIEQQAISHATLPPSALAALAALAETGAELSSVHTLIAAGEVCPPALARHWSRQRDFYNAYGPSEATVCVSIYRCLPEELQAALSNVPIGRPLANTQLHILDAQLQPAPIGVAGEIHIAGSGLARGYLRRPELTAARFIADPFSSEPPQITTRLYKTGDLGRWRADGQIEFLGRNDQQIKLRGYRIELGEIEACLAAQPQVAEAAVFLQQDAAGEQQLVACLQAADAQSEAALPALQQRLKQQLPAYMLPAAYVLPASWPRTHSGKVDRQALQALLSARDTLQLSGGRTAYAAPQGALEQTIASIWQNLLNIERVGKVGRDDNFFDLGGHSLLILQMLARLQQAGWNADVRTLFEQPTVAGLAAAARKNHAVNVEPAALAGIPEGCTQITPEMLPLVELSAAQIAQIVATIPGGAGNIQDIHPLAPLQEGLFFHTLLADGSASEAADQPGAGDAYILPVLLSARTTAQRDAFLAALRQVIQRHDSLRTALRWAGLPRPVQVVLRQLELPVEILPLNPAQDTHTQMQARLSQPARFDLQTAPLLRIQLAEDPGRGCHYLLLQLHHLICDHVSLDMLLQEISALLSVSEQSVLPPAVPYRQFLAQVLAAQAQHETAATAYFRSRLADVDTTTAPFGLLDVHGDGQRIVEARRALGPQLARRVRQLARQWRCSPATLFHAAFAVLLARVSGGSGGVGGTADVVFGSVLSGRLQTAHQSGQAGQSAAGVGMFINSLPLRLCLQHGRLSARQLLAQTRDELIALLAHEQTPLALAQRCSALPAGQPLFTALLNYRHSPGQPAAQFAPASGMTLLASLERTNYPFTVNVDDAGDDAAGGQDFVLTVQVDCSISAERALDYLQTALISLLDALERQPEQPVSELDVLPVAERRQLLGNFARPLRKYPQQALLHSAFEAHAARQPEAIALSFGEQSLSYGELDRRANQLAHTLIERGVGPETLVALCCERGFEMVVGLLGILKAGGAYLPLDPHHPAERLASILRDAAPALLLSQSGLRAGLPLPECVCPLLELDTAWAEIRQRPGHTPEPRPQSQPQPDHLAYVIYTSGSTGQPKGVMVEHRNVTRLFAACAEHFDFNSRDVWTQFHSLAFDFSVWEIWGALSHGGRLLIVPQETTRDLLTFYRLLCREQVTVLSQTPSAFRQLMAAQGMASELQQSLRYVIFGGEALELSSLQPWAARNGLAQPQLINMYGITETTVHVTCQRLTQEDLLVDAAGQGSLIGAPLADLQVVLLDAALRPVPIGVPGEIFVAGAGLARGYLHHAELSAERFIAHPFPAFSTEPGARLYKSGDLARWREDGRLDYLGRNDQQVKIRGHRIELGEIEAQLRQAVLASGQAALADVTVIARADRPGEKTLVAYLVPSTDGARQAGAGVDSLDIEALKEHLRRRLPDYMLPSAHVVLRCLPLTINGKLDVAALPAPRRTSERADENCSAPQSALTPLEQQLADAWQRVLGSERVGKVGRHDNFFELGGHSLLIIQLLEELRPLGLLEVVSARSIFDHPTPAALAAAITATAAASVPARTEIQAPAQRILIPPGCSHITPDMLPLAPLAQAEIEAVVRSVPGGAANVQDIYPLAPLQAGILFQHQLSLEAGGSDAYILPTLLRIATPAQAAAFIQALRQVVARHEVLRTAIVWRGLSQPLQVVLRQVELPVENFTLDAQADVLTQLEARMLPGRQRMDLQKAPLLRVWQAQDPQPHSEQQYLLLLLHHIISDHVSLEILVAEGLALLQDAGTALPPPVPYREFVAQTLAQAERDHAAAEQFFRARLADVAQPSAAFGLLDVHGDGRMQDELRLALETALAGEIRAAARRQGCSVAALFHTAWALLLAQCSGREDVVFGAVLSGRLQGVAGLSGMSRMPGLFINTLPLRCRLQAAGAAEAVRQMQQELIELLRFEQTPLTLAQQVSGLPAGQPLFTSVFNFRHGALPELPAGSGIELLASHERTNYPLTVSVDDLGGSSAGSAGFLLTAQVDVRIGAARLLNWLQTALRVLVQALATHQDRRLLDWPLLTASERQWVAASLPSRHAPSAQTTPVTARSVSAELMATVTAIWQEVLQVEPILPTDHFFELGGHSLLVTQVIARIHQRLGCELRARTLFDAPCLQDFVAAVSMAAEVGGLPTPEASAEVAPLPALQPVSRQVQTIFPLSAAQQRLWFIEQLLAETETAAQEARGVYHISGALRLSGRLDQPALQLVLQLLARRHEALRTAFPVINGTPCQQIAAVGSLHSPHSAHFPLAVASVQHDEVEPRLAELLRQPFDLSRAPLARALLLTLADDEHVLGICLHHLIADGWSMDIFMREFSALYAALVQGQSADQASACLPPLTVQYADYSVWQQQVWTEDRLHAQRAYWLSELGDVPQAPELLCLPTDHPRPARFQHAGASLPFHLDAELTAGLRALARRHELTLFMLLYSAWAMLLARLANQDEVVIGVPVANRHHADTEGVIGCFVNTLALRTPLDWSASLAEFLAAVRNQMLAAFAHQEMPFEQLVDILNPTRSLSHSPLFQVMFDLQNANMAAAVAAGALSLPGLELSVQRIRQRSAHVDLSLLLQETGEQLEGELEYATALFEADTVTRWLGHWQTLLRAMVAAGASVRPIAELPLLDDAQRALLLETWNATATDFPSELCFHQLFEAQTRQRPDALAVSFADQQLSYGELNAQANQLARQLRSLGVRPDADNANRVAICLARGLELPLAVLATFKAGAAYLPLDADYPDERLVFMLQDAAPRVLLTRAGLRDRLTALLAQLPPDRRPRLLDLDADWPQITRQAQDNLPPVETGVRPEHLAYVIYTSGSTGQPKGVMLSHRGLVSLATTQLGPDALALGPDSRVLQVASFSFDACTWEIVMAWAAGGSLHLAPRETLMPGEPLLDTLRSLRISHVLLTPTALAAMPAAAAALADLRVLLVGGEACPQTLLAQWTAWLQRVPGRRMINAYGPTEATICVSTHHCAATDGSAVATATVPIVPIGRPLANNRIYILDARGQPTPIGVAGEIHIGGLALAQGYLQRPELTAQRFVADPFVADPGARMYCTGDLGRWNAQGEIDYLGRNDRQIKLRGLRIEPGEIEAALRRCAGVREAVVLGQDVSIHGRHEQRLLACLTPQAGCRIDIEPAHLQERLRSQLPAHMLPAAYLVRDELPLTANGKLDQQALLRAAAEHAQTPGGHAQPAELRQAPQGALEETLAAIWREVLPLAPSQPIDRRDDFFDLGGHSLLAVQCAARIRQRLGCDVALRDLFEQPQLQALALHLQENMQNMRGVVELPGVAPREQGAQQDWPLSWEQQRLWFIHRLAMDEDDAQGGADRAYHLAGALRLRGRLDQAALRAALDALLARHEILRSRFVRQRDEPRQYVVPVDQAGFVLRTARLAGQAELAEQLMAEIDRPFDLAQALPIRGLLLRLAEDEHILCLALHHIVADGWSINILQRELALLYQAASQGASSARLPPLPLQYADYAVWQRQTLTQARLQIQLDYWRQQLAGAPVLLNLPTARPRPLLQDHAGALCDLRLDSELSARLKRLARAHEVTPFMLFHAAWAMLLGALASEDDVVIGVPVANRPQRELEGLIGFFVNTLALRLQLSAGQTLAQLLAQAREVMLQAQAHQNVPFEQVIEALKPPRSSRHSPLFQVLLAWQNTPEPSELAELPGLQMEALATEDFHQAAQFELSLLLHEATTAEGASEFVGKLHYATALFDAATMTRWLAHFRALLEAMAVMPEADAAEQTIALLPLPAAAVRQPPQPEPAFEHAPATAVHAAHEPPQGDVEIALAAIWREVLALEPDAPLARQDDFFELGGHSLKAIQVQVRLSERCGVELPLLQLFQHSRLAAQAEAVVTAQLAQFDAAAVAQGMAELDGLSEAELLKLLAEDHEQVG